MSQGHGHATSLAQIAADVLQIPIENIDVVQGDTRQVQAGHGTFNSRSMAVGGSGLHIVSQRIVAKAKKIAAGMLEVDEADVSAMKRQIQRAWHRHPAGHLHEGCAHGLCGTPPSGRN